MAKAIHWPAQFLEEIIAEDTAEVRCAFRIGRLYFDEPYWTPDEVVDIRVNHEKIRKAVIVGELKCCRVQDLTADDLQMQKEQLRTMPDIVAYLCETYHQPVDMMTEVTVVYYRNL